MQLKDIDLNLVRFQRHTQNAKPEGKGDSVPKHRVMKSSS